MTEVPPARTEPEGPPIVAFLAARWAEEETVARSASLSNPEGGETPFYVLYDDYRHDALVVASGYALADLAAKRAMLDAVFTYEARIDGEYGCCCPAERIRTGGCRQTPVDKIKALHLLAQPYRGHPDFNPAWVG